MQQLTNAMLAEFPQITTLCSVVNSKVNESFYDLEVETIYGPGSIEEQMEDLRFTIGPKSFFQTNTEQALELYRHTRRMAGLTGSEVVYDLYAGTGTIGLFVAHQAASIIGVEYVEGAVADACVNARRNKIDHARFFAGDMAKVLNHTFIEANGKPDVVITDPPRGGMTTEVVEALMAAQPQRIVYVSCNPATQARDLALMDYQYEIAEVQPVDMFPHTDHVENIVRLERK